MRAICRFVLGFVGGFVVLGGVMALVLGYGALGMWLFPEETYSEWQVAVITLSWVILPFAVGAGVYFACQRSAEDVLRGAP